MNSKPLPTPNNMSLGEQIRQQRKVRQLTLVQLAELCDISPSFLSQIERDQANPSVTTLYTIAEVFDIPMAAFFEKPLQRQKSQSNSQVGVRIVKANRRKTLVYPGSGIRNELLTPDLQGNLQMMWIVMPPGTDTGEVPFVHEGEECGIVLQGQVETWIGDEHYILEPGDAIYHPSTIPHRSRSIGEVEAIMVLAKTPPSI